MPSWTIASMRAWPNAPRDCLLASTSRSVVTCEVEVGEVLVGVVDDAEPLVQRAADCPWCCGWSLPSTGRRGGVTESSRSLTARAISAWRPASACAHRLRRGRWSRPARAHFAQAVFQLVGAHRPAPWPPPRRPAGRRARTHDGDRSAAATSASAPKPTRASPRLTGRSPTMKRISFMRLLVADSAAIANEEGTCRYNGLIPWRDRIMADGRATAADRRGIDRGKSAA